MSIFLKILGILLGSIGGLLALILLILILLLFCKSKLMVGYWDNQFRLQLRFLFIRYTIFPKKEKKKTSKTSEPPEKNASHSPKPSAAHSKSVQKQSSRVSRQKKQKKELKKLSFSDYIGILNIIFRDIFHYISCDMLHLEIVVASEDAAQTALNYGRIHAALEPLLGALSARNFLNRAIINITPDFCSEQSQFYGKAVFSLRLFRILGCIYHIYKKYF